MEFLISSHRGRPGDDPIFSLHAEAKKRAAAGEDVVNATIGALLHDDGRLAVMPSVVEALSSVDPAVSAAYAPIPGRADFRQAVIEDLLAEHGLVDQAVAVATPGGSGALRLAMDNFLERGQTVLTSSYFWGPYRTLSDESGRSLATFNMFNAEGRFDVADLERQLEAQIKAQGRVLLLLNTPCHNPTGYSLDKQEWDATVEVIERLGARAPIITLLDVAYGYYAKPALAVAIKSLARVADKSLVAFAWSASKTYAQYGLRVGSLVVMTPDAEERASINNALTYSCRGLWSNCNAGGMAGITRVLTDEKLRARANSERDEIVDMLSSRVACWNELAGAAGINYPRYNGGFFTTVFCEEPAAVAARLRERGVYVVPLAGALRVAMCAVNEKQIARIVEGLAATLPR
jgi:aromatic-amino-acid transaminase